MSGKSFGTLSRDKWMLIPSWGEHNGGVSLDKGMYIHKCSHFLPKKYSVKDQEGHLTFCKSTNTGRSLKSFKGPFNDSWLPLESM